MLDPAEFGKAMAAIVRDAQAPLLKRIEELEARQPLKGDPGSPGIAGKDAEPIEISAVAAEVLAGDEMAALVSLHAAEAVEKYFASNPPKQGERGIQGESGKDAPQVSVSDVVTELLRSAELKAMTERQATESVTRYFEANPIRHGKDGAPGTKGDPGESIKGDPGEPGVGLAGAIIDREGELVITTTKGEAIKLGKVVGKDGEPGNDGADFSDASLDYDGERGLIIRGKGGEIVRRLPIPLDKGYWREGMACEKADILTHGGNAWIALKDTSTKPCLENDSDWRLFARKGRDGADGRAGRDLGPPQPVKLTNA
jgi:hypothetical protein